LVRLGQVRPFVIAYALIFSFMLVNFFFFFFFFLLSSHVKERTYLILQLKTSGFFRFMQKENPALEDVPILFMLTSPFGPVIPISEETELRS
jgi:hypothetical protein